MPSSNASSTWLHLGAGSFHRAHQAWYLHRLREAGDASWRLALANIRNDAATLLHDLAAQHGAYTLETVDTAGRRAYERITSIDTIVPWDADLAAVCEIGAAPETRVISFTVTEGGYYLDQQHQLDTTQPDIATDLRGGACTLYGALARVLRQRMRRGGAPVTLLNCDNLRHNGERVGHGLRQFLTLHGDEDLVAWLDTHASTPNTMVDRITPRPTDTLRERVAARTGWQDRCPVMAETFVQWVVEDDFRAGRPALERVGVEFVSSVLPYEEAKIRVLNASHSCIAWAGTLLGLRTIDESVAVPSIRRMAWDYVTHDVIPCLTPSPVDLAAYRDTVLDRFANPHIGDTNQRVAADGFSKIPGFITPTLVESFARGHAPLATAMLPALFFVFLERWGAGALPYAYQDGQFDPAAARAMLDAPDPVAVYCQNAALWGSLAGTPALTSLIRDAVGRVRAWLGIEQAATAS
ncbi:Mannitol 2-dehydrogenase [Ralstonia mannitolilytica]|uniref:D-arabinitol 4-dehydrogenase n=1 Tax=Ralstonia mannitolilytica TaxID=105219 RepID=UPI0028F51236|nr:D-arabinitol 4-dehydrogenase [Ralstonia mannitolilytica]CAJ0794353.1 Mannitol 2-dehydrogenase [Ralstonia mannitolilytica]